MPYLIDGHNLIAALPDLELDDPYDEAKLALQLRAWAGRERQKVYVVFDGGLPGGYSRELSTGRVQVTFAAERRTNADAILKARLSRLPDPGNWTLVSSDHEVRDRAQQVGARVLTSQEFAAQLVETLPALVEKPEVVSPSEVHAWLQEFPEPPEAPEKARAAKRPKQAKRDAQTAEPPAKSAPARGAGPVEPPARGYTSRPIGEQLGVEVKPEPRPRREAFTEKPDTLSPEELEAWLQEFPEPPPRPAKSVERPAEKSARARKPTFTVDKRRPEALSSAEVADWLELFPEVEGAEPEAKPAVQGQRKEPLDEESALWQRLYGDAPTVKRSKRGR